MKCISNGPGLDSEAELDENGMINVSLKVKGALPAIPNLLPTSIEEFGVERNTGQDIPPLNIVIMIVGSRGIYSLFRSNLVPRDLD
jgi:hypothetical protein